MKRKNVLLKQTAAVLSLALAFSLTACGSKSEETAASDAEAVSSAAAEEESAPAEDTKTEDTAAGEEEKNLIRYSKSQGPYTELFESAVKPILEKEGYELEGVDFSDLLTADIALNDGEVDFNVEQHTAYAENFNANYDGDLTPISPIPTVPAGIYSDNHKSLDEITDGAKIAVPNDASNTSRAYVLLQKAGWIKLDPDADLSTITQDDIIENPYNIEFTEMKSLTIPQSSQDFDYIVITGSIVYNAGIDASTALLTEDILDHLILQVVVKEENKDSAWAKAIVDAYHSDEFKQYLEEDNDGLWYVPDELK